MPTGYQIKDQSAPHYLTFQLVYWIDLFSRQLQDLYALCKVSDTSYKSMGKITLLTYELKTLDMVIVPLEGVSYNFGDVQTELNKIYGPLGIEWRVKTDSVFRNKQFGLIMNDILDAEESESFSMYSPEMRALNRLYKEQRGVDSKTMYMFVVKEINGKRGGLLGDMPLSSQFGYLAASNDVKLAAKTIAHELGHGMFYLRHTFSQYNLAEDSTDNLMDYKPDGTQLFKKQWDEIFDPRRPWFAWRQDEEEGAMKKDIINIFCDWKGFNLGYTFFTNTDTKETWIEKIDYLIDKKEKLEAVIVVLHTIIYIDRNGDPYYINEIRTRYHILIDESGKLITNEGIVAGIDIYEYTKAKTQLPPRIFNKVLAENHINLYEPLILAYIQIIKNEPEWITSGRLPFRRFTFGNIVESFLNSVALIIEGIVIPAPTSSEETLIFPVLDIKSGKMYYVSLENVQKATRIFEDHSKKPFPIIYQ